MTGKEPKASNHQSNLIKTLSLYLIVAFVSIFYLSHFTHYLFATDVANDEGAMAGAWRLVQGQVIYRDFFEFFAPGNFFLLALIYKLFGYSLVVTNYTIIVIDVIYSLLLFQVSYMMIRRWYAIIPPMLFLLIGFPSWFIFSHYWPASALLLAAIILLSVAMEKLDAEDKSIDLRLFWAGLFVGLAGIFLQSFGVYMSVLFIPVLYFRTNKIPHVLNRILLFCAGIALPVSGFVLYLLMTHAFIPFIQSQIDLLRIYPHAIYFLAKPQMSFYHIMTPVKLIFVISLVGSLLLLIFKKDLSDRESIFFVGNVICFLVAWQWLTIRNNVRVPNYTTAGLSFVFIIYSVDLSAEYIKAHYSAWKYKCTRALLHGIFVAIAIILMACLVEGISDIRNKAFHFTVNKAAYWTYNKTAAEDLVHFSNDAKKILGNDRNVFIYPLASTLYTLLNLHNTTRYDIIGGFGQAADAPAGVFKDVVEQLIRSRTKFIITYQWSYSFLTYWSQRNGVVFRPNTFERFIGDNYQDVLDVGFYALWELRSLKPGDTMGITIKGHPEFDETVTVTKGGYIQGPDKAGIKVEGLPPYAVKDLYAKALHEYRMTSDSVRVLPSEVPYKATTASIPVRNSLLSDDGDKYRSGTSQKTISVTVSGAVQHSGTLTLNDRARLTGIFAMKGSHLSTANLTNILIIRHHKEMRVNLLKFMQTKDLAYNPLLHDKDYIYVPKLSVMTLSVTLLGAVKHRGRFTVKRGATVMDSCAAAGGLLPESNLSKVLVVRRDKLIKVNLVKYIQTRDPADRLLLKNNDIVYIPTDDEYPAIGKIREAARKFISKEEK